MSENLPNPKTTELTYTTTSENKESFKLSLLFIGLLIIVLIVGGAGFLGYQNFLSPKASALPEINRIIKLVESPDQTLVAKYGITQDQLKSNTQQILNGAPDKNIPGLLVVRQSIEQGDLTLAHKQLVDVFTNWLWGRAIPTGPGTSDRVVLSEEEKTQADPENRYFSLKRIPPSLSEVRKEVGIKIIKLLYSLKK